MTKKYDHCLQLESSLKSLFLAHKAENRKFTDKAILDALRKWFDWRQLFYGSPGPSL
jgi:hypothetical protein